MPPLSYLKFASQSHHAVHPAHQIHAPSHHHDVLVAPLVLLFTASRQLHEQQHGHLEVSTISMPEGASQMRLLGVPRPAYLPQEEATKGSRSPPRSESRHGGRSRTH
jgi:hypothetical protein